MKWERVEADISLNDPESRFCLESFDDGTLKLRYRDWQNRKIVIGFAGVAHISYGFLPPGDGCAEGGFYRTTDSPLIDRLRERELLGPDEVAFHDLIGSNENQWCEVLAASHVVAVENG